MKKVISLLLAVVMTAGMMAGCSNSAKKTDDSGKTVITIGGWPKEKDPNLEAYNKLREDFMKKYPDIEIKTDDWGWDKSGFLTKAAANQLPDMFITAYTEISNIVKTGYAQDITSAMEKYGYTKYINDSVKGIISKDGKIYAVPEDAYIMGLFMNVKLFKQAGLVNEDGTLKAPKTWEELAQTAKIIHDKTGAAGYAIPTRDNCGGWHFVNIAWAYGTNHEFMNQKGDKWTADFADKETAAALGFIQDLKFKYDAIPENALLSPGTIQSDFAKGQVAMYLATPSMGEVKTLGGYGLDKADISVASMPEGPAGKFAQMGGQVKMFKNGLSEEQIDALFKWLEFIGLSPKMTDDAKASREAVVKSNSEAGEIIGVKRFSPWKQEGDDIPEVQQFENEMVDKYKNVDAKLFTDYEQFDKVICIPEPPVSCQQLYNVLDGCIQSVLTNKNADPMEVLKKAQNDFQINCLDKE